jgi:hypothetical protein
MCGYRLRMLRLPSARNCKYRSENNSPTFPSVHHGTSFQVYDYMKRLAESSTYNYWQNTPARSAIPRGKLRSGGFSMWGCGEWTILESKKTRNRKGCASLYARKVSGPIAGPFHGRGETGRRAYGERKSSPRLSTTFSCRYDYDGHDSVEIYMECQFIL